MISVQEAAEKLGVSTARVRALLKAGLLEGQKIGRAWAVSEASIAKRLAQDIHPGRPSQASVSYERGTPNIDRAHAIYQEAKSALTGCYTADFLKQARSKEEQAFWICVSDFFLQQKQAELIAQGVY